MPRLRLQGEELFSEVCVVNGTQASVRSSSVASLNIHHQRDASVSINNMIYLGSSPLNATATRLRLGDSPRFYSQRRLDCVWATRPYFNRNADSPASGRLAC
eukprot:6781567-Karenia_brevis.AAC.1